MKTATEIADSISQNISHIYLRPSMHVGSISASYSANSLDNLLFALHYQWAFTQDWQSEFRRAVDSQHNVAECGNLGFADAFRRIHEGGNDEDAAKFVLRNWREISKSLAMPLDDGSGRNALEVKL